MLILRKATLALAVVLCAPAMSYAADTPGYCEHTCTFNIQIAHARSYVISVTWTGSGGSSGTPVVSGMDKNESYSMGSGHYIIHAQYLDSAGTARNAAAIACGNQVKYSFTSHGPNCAAYDEAFVLVTRGN
jgi:hypothetical protein